MRSRAERETQNRGWRFSTRAATSSPGAHGDFHPAAFRGRACRGASAGLDAPATIDGWEGDCKRRLCYNQTAFRLWDNDAVVLGGL